MTKTNSQVISSVDVAKRVALGLRSGMTVRVWQKIQEKGKTRLQAYEGLILAVKHGREAGSTFTVRRVASGVGMEKVFPLYSPNIDKIEILRSSQTRRAKLYFIREKTSKEIRRRMKKGSEIFANVLVDEVAPVEPENDKTEAVEPSVTEAEAPVTTPTT